MINDTKKCACGEPTCVEPWEPGCGLGLSPEHLDAAQPVGRSGVLKRQVVTTYRDGSVRVAPLADRPSAPVGAAEAQPVGYLSKGTQDGEEAIGFRAGPGYRAYALPDGDTPLYDHPPPSTPEGSSRVLTALRILPQYIGKSGLVGPDKQSALACVDTLREALAQQPAKESPEQEGRRLAAEGVSRDDLWRRVSRENFRYYERVVEAFAEARTQPAAVDEFAEDRNRLLRAFMQECGVIGPEKAGVNLARGIKAALAARKGEET